MRTWYKTALKRALGTCAISVAARLPQTRVCLKAVGLRCSRGLFGDRIARIPLSTRRELRLVHVDDCYLAFELFWRGMTYYEPITRKLLETLVRPGTTFVDVGAHIGFFSLVMGLSPSQPRVIAFEPNPQNFRSLLANVKANTLTNVVCESAAISDQEGTGTLYLTDSDMSASLMRDFQAQDTKQTGSIEVPTTTLDSYLGRQRIGGRMVIKVDMEGHEPAFFRGAVATLARHRPDIVLEVLYDMDQELAAQLKALGYHFYPITDNGLVEEDMPRLVKRFPFLFLNHLISARPKAEVVELFEQARQGITNINLLETSKHFPKERWPLLWQTESEADRLQAQH